MSMQPKGSGEIPAETVRVARAAFPKGSLAIWVRDELGPLGDEEFADLFPSRGRHAWSPGHLALMLVLQFVEGLTDRQAADAVRARIDFNHALGLRLDDPGFGLSVLSEFRDRLVQADAGRWVLDGILAAAREKGLLTGKGKDRTDSTHVLSAARELCWLEMVAETLRAALNALAAAVPDWLSEVAGPDWFRHYATRAEESRFPKAPVKRDEIGQRIGVVTTVSTDPDVAMTSGIHAGLAARNCLPAEHWVDAGYPTAAHIVAAQDDHGVELHGPIGPDTTPQAKARSKGHGQDAFTIGWNNHSVTCPGGITTDRWQESLSHRGTPVVRVKIPTADCRPCPYLRDCVSSPTAERRQLTFRHHEEHDAIGGARSLQQTDRRKERYKIRAGVEGTISQGVQRCGLLRSRYRGLAETSLQHQLTGAAINLAASTPASQAPHEPVPAPATSQHFAPPTTRSTGRSRPGPELTNGISLAEAPLLWQR